MRTLVEVTWEKEGELEEGEPTMAKDEYWLLHFGLHYTIVNDMAVNYTVCICQNCKTGQLESFDVSQVRIIGTELKK
jgi:hypothetical protein